MEKNPQYESYAPNLHGIWDSGIIQRLKGTETVAQWAAALDQQFSSHAGGWEKQGINVENWAWEGHELADSVVYAKLPVAIPVEKPVPVKGCGDDDHVSTRMLKLHEQVSQPYVDAVAPNHQRADRQGRSPAGDGSEPDLAVTGCGKSFRPAILRPDVQYVIAYAPPRPNSPEGLPP